MSVTPEITVEVAQPEITVELVSPQITVEQVSAEVTVTATGPPGPTAGVLTYTQSSAASTWNIYHGFGYRPNVTVIDQSGTVIITQVTYPTENTVQILFNSPRSGTAHLS